MAKYKKRADGRYATSVTYAGKKFYFNAKTSAELDRKVQEFKIAKRSGIYSSDMPLKDWTASWLASVQCSVEPTTYASYTSYINKHILPRLGDYSLCDLQPANIRDFMVAVSKTLCSNTAGRVYAILKRILQTAVDDDMLAKTPMRGIKAPTKKLKKPRVALTDEQCKHYLQWLQASKHPEDKLMIMLAIISGLRRGEILGLRVQDVDFDRKTITVRQVIKKIDHQLVISPRPKTSTSRRTVSLPETIFPLLKAKIRANRLKAMQDEDWQPNELLFPAAHGLPMSVDAISQAVRRSGHRAGLPDGFSLHSLRHTSATLLLKNGVNVKVVQQRLGHSNASTTLNIYSHVLPGEDEKAAETLANII